QESCEAPYSPAAHELVRIGVEYARADERAGIEDRDLRRADFRRRLEHAFDVGLLCRVAVDRDDPAPFVVAIEAGPRRRACRRENRVAFARERAYQSRAEPRPDADHDRGFLTHLP